MSTLVAPGPIRLEIVEYGPGMVTGRRAAVDNLETLQKLVEMLNALVPFEVATVFGVRDSGWIAVLEFSYAAGDPMVVNVRIGGNRFVTAAGREGTLRGTRELTEALEELMSRPS